MSLGAVMRNASSFREEISARSRRSRAARCSIGVGLRDLFAATRIMWREYTGRSGIRTGAAVLQPRFQGISDSSRAPIGLVKSSAMMTACARTEGSGLPLRVMSAARMSGRLGRS